MDGLTILSMSDRKRQIPCEITHMQNLILKSDTNELTYKTKTDLQRLKTKLWLPKGECGEDG